jgi:hypothetical protein
MLNNNELLITDHQLPFILIQIYKHRNLTDQRNNKMPNSSNKIIDLNTGQNLLPPKIFRTENRAFCIKCNKPVDLVLFGEVAEKLKTNYPEVYRLSNQGNLYRLHNEKGKVMICLESLLEIFATRQTQKLRIKN